MFYQFGLILVLAAAAANGQSWSQRLRITTTTAPTTISDVRTIDSVATGESIDGGLYSKGESVIVGYKPVYGLVDTVSDAGVEQLSPDWDFKCPRRFGYYRYKQSCDIYVECRNHRSSRKVCPDGMHFKDNPSWSEYPCAYPPEAQCLIRENALPARPTAECSHQFGNFPITNEVRYAQYDRCSSYISCASGVAYVMNCTFGLVFNPAINLCDWPEQVPGCQDVFDFRCPVPHLGEEDMVINYRYPSDPECRYFYSCLNGRYRLLACDEGLVFDHRVGRCTEDDNFACDFDKKYPYLLNGLSNGVNIR